MLFTIVAFSLGLVATVNSLTIRSLGPGVVNLGTAGGFTILTKAGITAVPTAKITGSIGVSPIAATSITAFALTLDKSGTFSKATQVSGKVFAADYTAPTPAKLSLAVSDMEAAYTNAMGRATPNFVELGAGLIGGHTLAPGLYKWSTVVTAATDVVISGGSTDTWIFQIAGTFDLGTNVKITLKGGAQAKNIFWAVAGAVTLHVGSQHKGVILGATSITAQTGGTVKGRLLAQTAVALQMVGFHPSIMPAR